MNNIDRERVFELLSLYECLLTEAQKTAVENHYAYDLSFGEISKEQSISRAAVNENVKSALQKMEEAENRFHLLDMKKDLIKASSSDDVKKQLKEILEKYYGI